MCTEPDTCRTVADPDFLIRGGGGGEGAVIKTLR